MSEEKNNQIKWTKLWSELKSFQAPWKVKDLKKFGKEFGLALFFLICCFYELMGYALVAESFLFGNDYIRDVKNRQGTIKLPGVFIKIICKCYFVMKTALTAVRKTFEDYRADL